MMIQPDPAPDCKFDFSYKIDGLDWKCNCNEGLNQSPIDLSDPLAFDPPLK